LINAPVPASGNRPCNVDIQEKLAQRKQESGGELPARTIWNSGGILRVFNRQGTDVSETGRAGQHVLVPVDGGEVWRAFHNRFVCHSTPIGNHFCGGIKTYQPGKRSDDTDHPRPPACQTLCRWDVKYMDAAFVSAI
jgi:hypothetical protein